MAETPPQDVEEAEKGSSSGHLNWFDPDALYRPSDDALRLIATKGTLAVWRSLGKGPHYLRVGSRILYPGADLNSFLAKCRVKPIEK